MVQPEQKDLAAKVHTVQIALLDTEGTLKGRTIDNDFRVTKDIGCGRINGEQVRYLKFNPNAYKQLSPNRDHYIPLGDCESMKDFELHVIDWAEHEGIPIENVRFVRVDFATDCKSGNGDYFRKLCDMLILAFNVKHKVKAKDQYYGSTQISMEHKNNKAKWGAFEFECYNKAIQQESEGASWRLELRYVQDKRRKRDKPMESIAPMIDVIQRELRSLPDYYEKAHAVMNENLLINYHAKRAKHRGGLSRFISDNDDRIFSRDQIKGLFELAGESNPGEAARRYCKRHKGHDLIDQHDFEKFINIIDSGISEWVKNDPFLVDFFEGKKAAKPYISTVIEKV